ncbi:MAG TPA: DUF2520 domain-containing protein [Capillimicrobium sp.]|nr:DUF2520 domain-containing protein [Capillimicrobium sp.]
MTETDLQSLRHAVVGRGRLGTALTAALRAAGLTVDGPLGREPDLGGADVVILAVPDGEIAAAAAAVPPGPLVGHCSGATTLAPLAPHEAFSLHPLMTISPEGADFSGASAAVAGSTDRAEAVAAALARALGMRPLEVVDEDRGAYHAAASIAANFLVTLEAAAERLAATAGVDREALAPLVRAALENWIELGGRRALTGPIARGDHETVARQRAAIAERTPDLLPLFDALADATRDLAAAAAGATR